MIYIEQVIEQFDEYIDGEPLIILGREFAPSELLRDSHHSFYCRKLDDFIADNFDVVSFDNEVFYKPKGHDYDE